MSASVLISTFPPFPTLSLTASPETTFSDLYDVLTERYPELPAGLVLSPHRGCIPSAKAQLSSLLSSDNHEENDGVPLISLRLVPRVRGGKGGFGSQLRAAGGRMSSQKTSNNDSCRDLSGRRLSTIKEAKRLAEYIESEPLRKKAQQEAQKKKLEELEKKLGITSSADGASSSTADPLAGKKHRLDDTEYLEQSREIVDNVKSAVSVAMLKKKKKAKTSHSTSPPSTDAKSTAANAASTTASAIQTGAEAAVTVSEKILESPVIVPAVVALASA